MSARLGKESWRFTMNECATALSFDASGARVAIGDASGRIVALDASDGRVLGEWRTDPRGVSVLAWHPARSLLAVGGADGALRLHADDQQSVVPLGRAWLERIAWSPDGERCAVAAGPEVVYVDSKGQAGRRSRPLESTVTGLAWRAGGKQLLSACYGGVQVMEQGTLEVTRRFRLKGSILTLALSPNERIVACGCQDDTVHFWRFADGQDAQMSGYPAKPTSLSWRADSQALATNGGSTIIVWPFDGRGPQGRRPLQLTGHRDAVTVVAFAPLGNLLASGCSDGELRLWGLDQDSASFTSVQMESGVERIAWGGPDSRSLAAADAVGTLRMWRI